MYNIIQKRKIWLTLSSFMVGASIVSLILWGLNFGIDFTGGSLLEVNFLDERPSVSEVQESLNDLNLGSLIVQPIGETEMILRFQDTSEESHQAVLRRISDLRLPAQAGLPIDDLEKDEQSKETGLKVEEENIGNIEIETTGGDIITQLENGNQELKVEELRYDSVGPSIGQELKRKSLYAIIVVLIAIVLYIAWTFRKVSKPVASWKYGLTAIIALFHDVIIVLGIFALLGKFLNIEINSAFVAAVLTVLGYSVNDTIVVFDRVRENLPRSDEDFENTINTSVNQTIRRSINTSVTTLLVLLSILFFGGTTIRDFVLALSIGVFIGTYSSIFLASPVLVLWEKVRDLRFKND
ncbi:MAG: protein translocase subunit SecF [Patescibacteria group bacterium]